jgi:hypothetical protein
MEGEKEVAAMEEVKGKETTAEAAAADVSLKQLSKKLDDFAKERDWEKHHSPRNLLLAMVCIPLCLYPSFFLSVFAFHPSFVLCVFVCQHVNLHATGP